MYWLLICASKYIISNDHHFKTQLELTEMIKNIPHLLNFLQGDIVHTTDNL